jgi:hypothetical protein
MKDNIIFLFNSFYYSDDLSFQLTILEKILEYLNKIYIYNKNIDYIIDFQLLLIKLIDIKIGKKNRKIVLYTILNIINNYNFIGLNNFLATFIIGTDVCSSQKNYMELITTLLDFDKKKITYDNNNQIKFRKKFDRDYGITILIAELLKSNSLDNLLFNSDIRLPENRKNNNKANLILKEYRIKRSFVLNYLQVIETVIQKNINLIGNKIDFNSIPINALYKYKNLFNNKIRNSLIKYANKKKLEVNEMRYNHKVFHELSDKFKNWNSKLLLYDNYTLDNDNENSLFIQFFSYINDFYIDTNSYNLPIINHDYFNNIKINNSIRKIIDKISINANFESIFLLDLSLSVFDNKKYINKMLSITSLLTNIDNLKSFWNSTIIYRSINNNYKISKISTNNTFSNLSDITSLFKNKYQSYSLKSIFLKICLISKKNKINPPKFITLLTDSDIHSSTDLIYPLIHNDIFYTPTTIENELQIFSKFNLPTPYIIIWNISNSILPLYTKSFLDSPHTIFVKGRESEVLQYLLYQINNDIYKKNNVITDVNKTFIHLNKAYLPIKDFLKLLYKDKNIAHHFLFNFNFHKFVINYFKNYYYNVVYKNQSTYYSINDLIKHESLKSNINIPIVNNLLSIENNIEYSYLYLSWIFSCKLKEEYNNIISDNTKKNEYGIWSNILLSWKWSPPEAKKNKIKNKK